MKKKMVALLVVGLAVFTACTNGGGGVSFNGSVSESQGEDSISEDDGYTGEECFVSIYDGEDSYDIGVAAYGDEIELPEPKGSSEGGEFVGWINYDGLFAAGDIVISKEFAGYEAVYTGPAYGLLVTFDTMGNGYSITRSEEGEFEIENPYIYDYSFNSSDYYIDYYADDDGNRFDFGETVKGGKGEFLILSTVYSDDLSGAYKVSLSYNSPMDMGDSEEAEYRYVKKGESIPVESMIEYEGYTIDGWYDAPEGGNFVCANEEIYTPNADIDLFAHWSAK